jgi:hypothetical protein
MADIVYVLKAREKNEELRYSLRSLANIPHDNVWVVGGCPSWLQNVQHIPTGRAEHKWASSTTNMKAAIECSDISDDFIYFNDDFYCLRPLTEIPILHLGLVADVVKKHWQPGNTYLHGALTTKRLLESLGKKPVLSYDVHAPMIINKEKMQEALQVANWSPGTTGFPCFHKRTFYGNYWELGGEQIVDVKVTQKVKRPEREVLWNGDFLSSGPACWDGVRRRLHSLFPDPSQYEKTI